MKRTFSSRYIILTIALVFGFVIAYNNSFFGSAEQLVYDYKQSMHDKFYFTGNYVVFDTVVSIKNNTSRDLKFYMYADISEDKGLVLEDAGSACKKDSLEKESFFIKANSVMQYEVYFKAKKGIKNTKQNRLPPKKISFEIIQ